MTIQDLKDENACFSTTKELLFSNEYSEKLTLVSDVSTSLTSQGFNISDEVISQKIDILTTGIFNLPDFYFPGDTSLLYSFDSGDIGKMLIDNPGLSEYVEEHNIQIRNNGDSGKGIYLTYVLPEHLQLFESYNSSYFGKDAILLFKNRYLWKEEDSSVRYLISDSSLVNLYEDPSTAEWISEKSLTDYVTNNYLFLYEKTPYTEEQRNFMISSGAEMEEGQ